MLKTKTEQREHTRMAYMKMNDIIIPVFDGADYQCWKKRILKFLEYKKYKTAAERPKLSTDKAEEWIDMDVKATNYIYSTISNKQLEYVADVDTAYEIMVKLDEMYLKESTALQIVRRSNLDNIKLKNYQDSNKFFDEFEKAINELKAAGATVTEQEKLRYMLKALPSTYSHIGDLIDVLPETERTVEYLKSKIQLKEIEETTQSKEKESVEHKIHKSNVFISETKEKCYQCGKIGHFKKDCYYSNSNSTGPRGRDGHSRGWTRGRGNQRRQQRGRVSHRGNGTANYNYRDDSNGDYHRGTSGTPAHRDLFFAHVNTSEVNTEQHEVSNDKITWLLDSGCTDHIVKNDKLFSEYIELKNPVDIRLGDGRVLKATKIGSINTEFEVYKIRKVITLFNVFYVEEMKQNLLSFSKITQNNKIVSYNNISKIYNKNNKLIAIATKQENLYYMTSFMDSSIPCSKVNANVTKNLKKEKITLKERWHRTLGHVNFKYLDKLCKDELLHGIPKTLEKDYMKCAICIKSKMHNMPFKNNRKRASEILELVHTDLNGPHNTVGNGVERYFLSFIDDYSKLAKVYCIKSKSEVINYFAEYINLVENLTGKKIKNIRCDNGKEYINTNVYNLIREKGIQMIPCPPYVHELNGVAERYNRSIMDTARCLLTEANVSRIYWPEIIKASAYLKNRSLTNTLQQKTPYEIFFGERPEV